MTGRHPVEDRLVREVLRKLHLATEADHKDDREVICGEVFDDINGILDETSQAHLGVQRECRFYEVLAPYLSRKWDAAEGLLYVCRRLWGQPYVAPVYALLLHQWLLLNREAGGGPERAKHINVMVSGAKQLFWGDIEGMRMHFRPLFVWLCDNVIFSLDRRRLDDLPPRSRRTLLSCCAGFMAYYYSPEELGGAILAFPSPDHTLTDGGHVDGEGTDFVIGEITDTLKETTTEYSLLRCLRSLTGLQGNVCLAMMGRITKLRLQAELSSLSSPSGLRFISRRVNNAAFEVFDALWPLGRGARRRVVLIFWAFVLPSVSLVFSFLAAVSSIISALGIWFIAVGGHVTRWLFGNHREPQGAPRGIRQGTH
eukprot:jgi/Botrbrau1/18512/Bobra.0072s0087.1